MVTAAQVKSALPKIEKYVTEAMRKTGVPGVAIAVVFEDRVAYLNGFGVCEVGKKRSVTAETVFQIASMSKPMAATVVAALVSDKLVTWDTRVSQLDPSFQLMDAYPTSQVTVRDLFSHRSGLGGNAGNDLELLGYDRETILHRLRFLRPASSFRSAYAYSNFGLTAGAVAAAKPSGKAWEVVAEEKIYQPLGMSSTSSRHSDFLKRANRTTLHVRLDGKWTAAVKRLPDAQSPAGGVSSNVKDLAQWMRLVLSGGKFNGAPLISEAAISQTHSPIIYRGPHVITGNPSFYGLGWNIDYGSEGTIQWGHAGAFSAGAHTFVGLIPSEQLGIVTLTNGFPIGVPEAIAASFFDFVHYDKAQRDWLDAYYKLYDKCFGPFSYATLVKTYSKPPAKPSPALPKSAYIGTYTNDYFGNANIIESSGGLALQLGPNKITFPLKHYDRDHFVYYPYGETPGMPAAATFLICANQKASQVTLDDLNSDGQGVLTRVTPAR